MVEALLLWALQQRSASNLLAAASSIYTTKTVSQQLNPKDITRWALSEYTEMARELDIIAPDTASQVRLVEDFRNPMHPGRAIRLGQSCNRGTALSGAGGMELVIRDLSLNSRF